MKERKKKYEKCESPGGGGASCLQLLSSAFFEKCTRTFVLAPKGPIPPVTWGLPPPLTGGGVV